MMALDVNETKNNDEASLLDPSMNDEINALDIMT